ncbi:MAG: DHHA1 domain-containing protein, partial [bacterium]|nr:DHHA1 domain-containing protein [bacterium]
ASDTGFFRFRNATSSAHRDAAKLIDCGAQFRKVAIHLSERKTRSELCLMEKSLSTMEQHYDEKIVTIMIKKEFHERCGTSIDDGEGIVDLARSIPGAAVAILLREVNESTTRVSMRSEENVNVGAIAKSLGGGGHKVAAGCTLHHSIDEAKQIVINLVGKELP